MAAERSNLRVFHNWLKSELLRLAAETVCSSPTLVDFGCGRGGDLKKWVAHGVGHVLAFDPDEASVEEAKRRAESIGAPPTYRFVAVEDTLGYLGGLPPQSADVVTAMFSLHYIPPGNLAGFMKAVERVLCPGGVLLLTFMNAETVMKSMDADSALRMDGCSVELGRRGEDVLFRVRIDNTLYFGDTGESVEHMMFPSRLSKLSHQAGLTWIDALSKPFGEWRKSVKKFSLTEKEAQVSNLFSTGVAIKGDSVAAGSSRVWDSHHSRGPVLRHHVDKLAHG